MINKKANGLTDSVVFIFMALILVITIGFYDFFKVEYFEPTSDLLKNLTLETEGINTTHPDYLAMLDVDDMVEETVFPFNLIFIGVCLLMFFYSMYKAVVSPKYNLYVLFTQTLGGLLLIFFAFTLVLIDVINYFTDIFLNYLFVGVVSNYVPSYIFVQEWYGLIILIWALSYALLNYFFGVEEDLPTFEEM